jgi:hypothetical protein
VSAVPVACAAFTTVLRVRLYVQQRNAVSPASHACVHSRAFTGVTVSLHALC